MSNRLNIWKILFLIFLMAGTAYVIRNSYKEKNSKEEKKTETYISNKGKIFGTFYSITYCADRDLHTHIKAKLQDVDNSLSPFNKNSIISAINNNRDTLPDRMFLEVFTLAQEISRKTGGAFDITVAPLVNAWGFGFKQGTPVDKSTIDSLRRFIGYSTVELVDGNIIKQHPETMLDCSAIAKGYGCDAVAEMLESHGVENFMVEIGGEIVTRGHNSKGQAWSIGISKPTDNNSGSENGLQKVIAISDKGMATSGNYRNFRIENGKKIAHTIDPRTGYPVQHTLLSATVIADNCAIADAYATAFMVMGLDEAIEFCSNEKNIEAYFIYADEGGTLKTAETAGMKKYY